MEYVLHPFTDSQQQWDEFIRQNFSFYSFLSGWQRGEFNQYMGNSIHRFGIYNTKKLIGIIQLVQYNAKRGRFFLAPHSPLIQGDYFAVLKDLLPQIATFAKQHNVDFLRINGITENTQANLKQYQKI